MLEQCYDKETKTLRIPFNINEKLKDLPLNIEIIIFEENDDKNQHSMFDKSVDNLPSSLKYLTFGSTFNQKVDKLPNSLIYLTFGRYFNQTVNNLPKV